MKLHLMRDLSDAVGEDDSGAFPLPETRTKAIAVAFFDAYVDTIDYEGEAIEDAVAEVKDVFAGAYGRLIPDVSGCYMTGDTIISALFAAESKNGVFIPYVITTKKYSGQGYATRLIQRAILRARESGYGYIDLYVTKGNTRAENIYRRLGFKDAPREPVAGEAHDGHLHSD